MHAQTVVTRLSFLSRTPGYKARSYADSNNPHHTHIDIAKLLYVQST